MVTWLCSSLSYLLSHVTDPQARGIESAGWTYSEPPTTLLFSEIQQRCVRTGRDHKSAFTKDLQLSGFIKSVESIGASSHREKLHLSHLRL